MAIKSLLLFILLIVLACSDNDNDVSGCGLDNPREELAWLKSRVDSMARDTTEWVKYCYVAQGNYKRRTVFQFGDCNPAINKIVFTLNCDGNRIDSNDDPIFTSEIKNIKIIWKPDEFACETNF
jgi:hypothetical protein